MTTDSKSIPATAADARIPVWHPTAQTRSSDEVPVHAATPPPRGDSAFPELLEAFRKPGALGLGHYDVLEVLGRGGFGTVVKAFDLKLQRTVAIKMMSDEMASTSPARKRFLREARASAAVRHDNVVQIYAVEENPVPYLVMEFIPGESLQQFLDKSGPLEAKDIVRYGAQIARGLAAAHETNLVHRDIKPANILLERGADRRAKLTDFGLARAADDASLTQSGVVAGTPMYMAPEQACGESFDHRADLFSFGSVLYVMASGRPPFRASSSVAVLKRVVEETPRPIKEIIPEVPQWLCDIIAKLHAKRAEDRYQTAAEVAEVLADCQAQLQVHGELKDISKIPTSGSSATAITTPKAARPATVTTSFRPYTVAIGVVLLILAIGTAQWKGWLDFRGKPGAPLAAAAFDGVSPTYTNPIGITFIRIPKGRTWLGGGGGNAGPQEAVIERDFYLGQCEVTQQQWMTLMDRNPSHYSRTGLNSDDVVNISDDDLKRFPVESVSWDLCQEFVARLNVAFPVKGWVYRLPLEMEWEYACRGGPAAKKSEAAYDFYLGETMHKLPVTQANYLDAKLNRPCPVGSYPPNKLGLHDMHGNVFEYVEDVHMKNGESLRMFRGGAWMDDHTGVRARACAIGVAHGQYNGGGLRVALVPR